MVDRVNSGGVSLSRQPRLRLDGLDVDTGLPREAVLCRLDDFRYVRIDGVRNAFGHVFRDLSREFSELRIHGTTIFPSSDAPRKSAESAYNARHG